MSNPGRELQGGGSRGKGGGAEHGICFGYAVGEVVDCTITQIKTVTSSFAVSNVICT